jgi:hypothetical protein
VNGSDVQQMTTQLRGGIVKILHCAGQKNITY